LVLHLAPYGVADLGMLVAAGWRGRGVGSALLAEGIERARAAGAHKIALQVWPHNRAALALYERFGFRREGLLRRHYRRRSGELWDAVVMGLPLD
jgi:ribosomal protein S18 acetylase RimI-like enzyme